MPIYNVGDAMREMKAGSKHIKSRAQAIAVGLKAEREGVIGGKKRGRKTKNRPPMRGTGLD